MEKIADPKLRSKNFEEVAKGLTKEEVLSEANRCLKCANPLCTQACPAAQKIPMFIKEVAGGNMEKALELIVQDNPFPISTGRVCPAFCQKKCIRGMKGEPINIRLIKRYVTENTDFSKVNIERKPLTGKKIAIIGAGPAGLSAGFFLSKEGHDVTIFEKLKHAGGMLYYGIPSYRLPKDNLLKELELIKRSGLKIKTSHKIEDIETLEKTFDAILLSVGAYIPNKMNIPGEEKFINSLDFLQKISEGKDVKIGKTVAVIGGGNVAIDIIRTAIRLGAEKAYVIYRKEKKDMPALPEEIRQAEEEGVEFMFSANPISYDKKLKYMQNNKEIELEIDTVFSAIGQKPEKINLNSKKIFIGGDFETGPSTVVQALASGKTKADEINDFLSSI